MDPVVIITSRTKLALATAGALGFVGLGYVIAAIAYADRATDDTAIYGVAAGGVVMATFGVFAAMGLAQIAFRRPLVRMDETGLVIGGVVTGDYRVRWSEIADLVPFRVRAGACLGVELADERAVLQRASWRGRIFYRLNRLFAPTGLSIPGGGVDRDLGEIETLIWRFMAADEENRASKP